MTARLLSLLIAIVMLSTEELWSQHSPATSHPNTMAAGEQTLPCGFTPVYDRLMLQENYRNEQELLERKLYQRANEILRTRRSGRSGTNEPTEILTIPIVIHIIHLSSEPNPGDGPSNPSDEQILRGIEHLNQAYRNTGVYAEHGHNPHEAVQSVDTGIEFCLAQVDIQGRPTSGILRYANDTFSELNADQQDPEMQQWVAEQDGNAFPGTDYAHVWLVKQICRDPSTAGGALNCNIGGYAYYPSGHGNVYNGVIGLSYLWGTTEVNSKNHIHEFGHYLGLYHTFQGGCPNGDCLTSGDRVCDTPPDNRKSFTACGEPDNSCQTDADDTSANNPFSTDVDDLYENYMDYTSKWCQNTFTQGQTDRMRAVLTEIRSSLLYSQACRASRPTPQDCGESELMLMEEKITPGVYENAEMIYASGEVDQNGNVTMRAAQGISLLPGFRSGKGTTLQASIAPCVSGSAATISDPPSADQDFYQMAEEPLLPVSNLQLEIAPNPLFDEGRIRYYLPAVPATISMILVDMNGRKLIEIPTTGPNQGWNEHSFSGESLPAGMYFLLLRTEEQFVSRKIMVVRW